MSQAPSFSFACSGWLACYHFGVAKRLQELQLSEHTKFIGSSGGSLAAAGIGLHCDFDQIVDLMKKKFITHVHQDLRGAFTMRSYLKETMQRYGNLEDYAQLNRKQSVTIVYSALTLTGVKSRRISQFQNEEEVANSIIASCTAPPIAGFPFELNNDWVIDGGISDFQPVFNSETITVSPFYFSNATIHPSKYVPIWWACYPPAPCDFQWTFDLGYYDATNWAKKNGLDKGNMEVEQVEAIWKSKIGRILGYRFLENQILDLLFIAFLVWLWKPIIIILLYVELWIKAIFLASKAFIYNIKSHWSSVVIGSLCTACFSLVASKCLSGFSASPIYLPFIFMTFVAYLGHSSKSGVLEWKKCLAVMRNIASLSLILQIVPVVGSTVVVKRHHYLLEQSFIYRLTSHIIY